MKKQILPVLLLCALMFALCAPASATGEMSESAFAVVSIPYHEGDELWQSDYQKFSRLYARYADDKTPIALSQFYDGYLFATVPAEDAGRDIEGFVAEDVVFTDDDGTQYEFSMMQKLAHCGVIRGNDKGEALPFDNISRAEATAMVMRFMGLEAARGTDSGFADVPEDAWYASVVTAAKAYGIIEGDSATSFSPERNVSRQEFVTMASRAVWCADMQEKRENVTAAGLAESLNLQDADKIADWALSAYEVTGDFCIADWASGSPPAEGGEHTMAGYADPQKAATRFEAAELLFRVQDNYQIYPSRAAIEYGFDKAMPVIDGSTSTYPFTDAVYRGLFSNGWKHPGRPEQHSKSHASYEMLINGERDMLFASVYPASDILALAGEKGVELELIPIAYDAMVFFTNADNPATGLTKAQISDIYVNNAYPNWSGLGGPDALLYPYCRNSDSGSHAQMERHFLNGGEINEKIRNETTSISMSNVLTDVMGAQTDEPLGYALGYSIFYYFNSMDLFYDTKTQLKLLSIDGVYPTDETIADGSYPLSNNAYIVLRKDTPADAPARQMAEYMLTAAGQECVVQAGYGPLKAN